MKFRAFKPNFYSPQKMDLHQNQIRDTKKIKLEIKFRHINQSVNNDSRHRHYVYKYEVFNEFI